MRSVEISQNLSWSLCPANADSCSSWNLVDRFWNCNCLLFDNFVVVLALHGASKKEPIVRTGNMDILCWLKKTLRSIFVTISNCKLWFWILENPIIFPHAVLNLLFFPNQQNQLIQCSVVPVSHSIAFYTCFPMMPQHFGSRVTTQYINKCLSRNLMAKNHWLGLVFKTLAAVSLPSNALQSGIKQKFEVFRHFRFDNCSLSVLWTCFLLLKLNSTWDLNMIRFWLNAIVSATRFYKTS